MPTAADLTGGQFSEQQIVSLVESRAAVCIWEGAIRSGKTIASIVRWLRHLDQTKDLEGEAFIFGRTRDAIGRNIFGPLKSVPLLRGLAPGTEYRLGAPTAQILGQTVHVIGANDRQAEEKVRGLTGRSAYGDELTVLPAPFFRQALGRLSVDGAAMFGTTNPDNPNHWLRTEYLDRPRTQGMWTPDEDDTTTLDLATWHFVLDDNPFVSAKFKRDRKAEYTGLWYRRMILGEWVMSEGAIYESWDPAVHVVDELPPIARVLACGVDVGTTNPFAALMLAVTADGRLCLTREYWHDPKVSLRQMTDVEFSTALVAWMDATGERPARVIVDPSAESFQLQLRRDGIKGITDADNSVLDGIRLMASLLATRRLVVHRSCKALIREIPGYSWDDRQAELGIDKPIKVNDHAVDAARYALLTTQRLWAKQVPIAPWSDGKTSEQGSSEWNRTRI